MTALFVSDLHLDASRPAATRCFLRFLEGQALEAGALYILGDLFEVWTGDDAAAAHQQEVIRALARYAATGRHSYFLRGNRDFLAGDRFAAEAQTSLLDDETVIEIAGRRALLMHGDTLCTDDHAYQRYRRIVRLPATRALYLALPASIRAGLAGVARRRSTRANAGKPPSIMDVSPLAVIDVLRRHGVQLLIHGHTHRPAVHNLEIDGRAAQRIVLGAWYEQGSILRWTGDNPELGTLAFG